MGAAKAYLEEVALRDFGAVTERTLELSTPIAEAELLSARARAAIAPQEHEEYDACPYCGQLNILLNDVCPRCDRYVEAQ